MALKMRRTYRSKKHTDGALDHRDVLQNMDEKSSVFDAFYIQNLKQTKRELSCLGPSTQHGVASNKVRKRKYVKRIVKEVENLPQRESISTSAYLTPDKSLRVNKILDPFDMLLNSSTTGQFPIQENKQDVFKILRKNVGKTYTRRELKKSRKLNYSSSDSFESDKENVSDLPSNVTDIRKHELLIEQESSKSLKYVDESINKIVNNLSLIKNFKGKINNGSVNTSYKYRNRLTKNCYSPILQKSPPCSTPFKEKYRGKSIYNFSPISSNRTQNDMTIAEENNESNDSIVFLCKPNVPKLSKDTSLPSKQREYMIDKASESLIYEDHVMVTDNIVNAFPGDNVEENEPQLQEGNSTEVTSTNPSFLQTTMDEPFLGFSGDKTRDSLLNKQKYLLKDVEQNDSNSEVEIDNSNGSQNNIEESIGSNKNSSYDSNNLSLNLQSSDKESMYDTCNSEQSDSESDKNIHLISVERVSDSLIKCREKSDLDNNKRKLRQLMVSVEEMSDSFVKNTSSSSDSSSSIKDKKLKVALKNDDGIQEKNNAKEPKVAIERMKNSIFKTYYGKMEAKQDSSSIDVITDESKADSDIQSDFDEFVYRSDDEASKSTDSDSSTSSHNCSPDNKSLSSKNNDSDSVDQPNLIIITDSSTTEDLLTSNEEESNDEEERFVSFVTTRRRNDFTKKSMFVLDNSCSSSTDCDKTVLTNKLDSNKTTDMELDVSIDNAEIFLSNDTCNDNTVISALDSIVSNVTFVYTNDENVKTIVPEENIDAVLDSCINEITIVKTIDDCVMKHDIDGFPSKELAQIEENFEKPVRSSWNNSRLPRLSDIDTESDSSMNDVTMVYTHDDNAKMNFLDENIDKELDSSINELTIVSEDSNVQTKEIQSQNKEQTQKQESYSNSVRSSITTRKSAKMIRDSILSEMSSKMEGEARIVLQPGKKWERSLSIYRRMTTIADHFDQSVIEDEVQKKGRMYRQIVITTMEMQDSLHNESINSRRSTFISKPSRSTIRLVKESNNSKRSLNSTEVFDDLKGFLSEECDDTVTELSKLSLAESEFEVTVLDVQETSDRIATAREYVLRRCNQTEPILFDECYPETVLKNCHKIGEGVYGEVFLWRARDGRARVMKIVPIAGTVKVNGEAQKDFHEVISEIVIAMELSALRAPIADIERYFDEGKDGASLDLHAVENATDVFNEVLAVRCVQGPYPSRLLDLWELYDECKGSDNDNPAVLPSDQQYIVLELANAGQDLESYQFTGAQQAHALFQQIAFGLAVGEESFQFEHRDLHWGNVLIAPTEQKLATFVLRGREYRVPRRGVAATIIDYSLSRISLPLLGERASLYNDLATDEQLFDAQGDYQFQVYRLMRHKLGNDWKNFEPYTNILWLHYTVIKMITALRYKRTNTKIHKLFIEKLEGIRDTILEFKSATDYVLADIGI